MATYYLDTSALAKRYTEEKGREWMHRLTVPRAGNDVLFSVLATIELEGALTRKAAKGALRADQRDKSPELFRCHLRSRYTALPISQEVRSAPVAWFAAVTYLIHCAPTTRYTSLLHSHLWIWRRRRRRLRPSSSLPTASSWQSRGILAWRPRILKITRDTSSNSIVG